MIPVSRPVISSEDKLAVLESLDETWISGEAPPVQQMEANLAHHLGVKEVVAVSSGTTAIDLAIEVLNVRPGEECLVPAFTIVSSVNALLRKGAKVILVDADPNTWSIDAEHAAAFMSSRTRMILPVHIYGLPVDMDPIMQKARQYEVSVIEDAAEALGVNYRGKPCGSIGDLGTFSFFANKIITGGEGGAIATSNSTLASRLRSLRNLSHSVNERFVHSEPSWNFRMPAMSAALINSQLARIDGLTELKQAMAKYYIEGLNGHPWFSFAPEKTAYGQNSYWVFSILLNDECPYSVPELRSVLYKLGIDTRRFFCPIHLQPFFNSFDIEQAGDLTTSEELWENGLYLPSGLGLNDSELDFVIMSLWDLVKA
jgi:perosamine synthetase